jgi:hypothetical protein
VHRARPSQERRRRHIAHEENEKEEDKYRNSRNTNTNRNRQMYHNERKSPQERYSAPISSRTTSHRRKKRKSEVEVSKRPRARTRRKQRKRPKKRTDPKQRPETSVKTKKIEGGTTSKLDSLHEKGMSVLQSAFTTTAASSAAVGMVERASYIEKSGDVSIR